MALSPFYVELVQCALLDNLLDVGAILPCVFQLVFIAAFDATDGKNQISSTGDMLDEAGGKILLAAWLEETVFIHPNRLFGAFSSAVASTYELTETDAVLHVVLVAEMEGLATEPHPPDIDLLILPHAFCLWWVPCLQQACL